MGMVKMTTPKSDAQKLATVFNKTQNCVEGYVQILADLKIEFCM
jgi:hypothetical protein